MKLLALDTASALCSAALGVEGELRSRASPTTRDHAALILPMIDGLLAEAGLTLRQLDGIAFGRGPGSFTGLRIAAAVTQGLAAGADLPVLPVSDLRVLAQQARRLHGAAPPGATQILACMDARMGEVYWACFDGGAEHPGAALAGEAVSAPAALPAALRGAVWRAVGRGIGAYPELCGRLGLTAGACLPEAEPHAADVACLAAWDISRGAVWQDAGAAIPVYLRDQVAQIQR